MALRSLHRSRRIGFPSFRIPIYTSLVLLCSREGLISTLQRESAHPEMAPVDLEAPDCSFQPLSPTASRMTCLSTVQAYGNDPEEGLAVGVQLSFLTCTSGNTDTTPQPPLENPGMAALGNPDHLPFSSVHQP